MRYKQLDYLARCKILAFWNAGYTKTAIAKEVGVHKSTISRELNKNLTFVRTQLGSWQYKPDYAQAYANGRHKNKPKHIKLTKEVKKFIFSKIEEDWSPEQISGYAKRHNLFSISHECIYQLILKDKQIGGKLYKHLRHKNKKYRKRYGSPKKMGSIRNRRFIDDRPIEVNEKKRIGDWEIDTIIGKNRKRAIVTIVERVSKKTILKKVEVKTAELVSNATISGLKPFTGFVFSITGDNGSEFAYHEKISRELQTDFVRQYLKKGSDFGHITDDDLVGIMNKLNNRPRKTLNYATPNEIFALCPY